MDGRAPAAVVFFRCGTRRAAVNHAAAFRVTLMHGADLRPLAEH